MSYSNTVVAQVFPLKIINKCEYPIQVTLVVLNGCPGPNGPNSTVIPYFTVAPNSYVDVTPPYLGNPNAFWTSALATVPLPGGVIGFDISSAPSSTCPAWPPWNWGTASNGLLSSIWGYPPFPYFTQIVYQC